MWLYFGKCIKILILYIILNIAQKEKNVVDFLTGLTYIIKRSGNVYTLSMLMKCIYVLNLPAIMYTIYMRNTYCLNYFNNMFAQTTLQTIFFNRMED